jgi:MerR family copper efflux transcriptional regulator
VGSYTIGEIAERSGFSASALRYYEGVGLVAPVARTGAGYRVYDDHTLARLAFIARAKQLGCSLEEISDLIAIWGGERCGPVQRRFHELVTDRIGSTQRQIAELTAFASQLRAAAGQLAVPPSDGPCGEGCACLSSVASPEADGGSIACTLEPSARPARVSDWHAILERAERRTRTVDGGVRLEFGGDIAVDRLARLAVAEQECCSFFAFTITVDARGIALEVRAPDGAEDVVAALFGPPA